MIKLVVVLVVAWLVLKKLEYIDISFGASDVNHNRIRAEQKQRLAENRLKRLENYTERQKWCDRFDKALDLFEDANTVPTTAGMRHMVLEFMFVEDRFSHIEHPSIQECNQFISAVHYMIVVHDPDFTKIADRYRFRSADNWRKPEELCSYFTSRYDDHLSKRQVLGFYMCRILQCHTHNLHGHSWLYGSNYSPQYHARLKKNQYGVMNERGICEFHPELLKNYLS